MDTILKEMGLAIVKERNNLNWTQQNLADAAGVSLRHIQNIEKGGVNLSFDMILKVLTCLGLSVDAFIYPKMTQIEKDMAHLRAKLSACTQRDCKILIKTMEYMQCGQLKRKNSKARLAIIAIFAIWLFYRAGIMTIRSNLGPIAFLGRDGKDVCTAG